MPLILLGLWNTLALSATCIVLGFVLGVALAVARLYGTRPVRLLAIAYIDVFRAIPVLVLLFIVYYALPFSGLRLSSFAAATAAIAMVSAAYVAEIVRAGIEAVPGGQTEAARALGLRFAVVMRKVILPQALRIVLPPLTSNSINVVKDTALASVVAMPDLLKQANQAQALAANPTPPDRGRADLPRHPPAVGPPGRAARGPHERAARLSPAHKGGAMPLDVERARAAFPALERWLGLHGQRRRLADPRRRGLTACATTCSRRPFSTARATSPRVAPPPA